VGTAARCRDQLSAWDETGVATVAVVAHPVQREETYVQGVCRSLAALAPS
jgi:alkanesulfonate monooxygenase SsuD/methylene tetrahydromethanopterin reductase-like flavin-dependent oxidoreductase (luciferase family)